MMKKSVASAFLASGLIIMLLSLGTASVAMQRVAPPANVPISTPSNCTYCHIDVHNDWNFTTLEPEDTPVASISYAPLLQTHFDIVPMETTQIYCGNCHMVNTDVRFTVSEIETRIDATQGRVATVRTSLNAVYAQHPEWDVDMAHGAKSVAQKTAERIDTLLDFIEADGSWGFHDPSYTEQILSDAESLMAELLTSLD